MNNKIQKRLTIALMFMSDMALSSWIYFSLKSMSFINHLPQELNVAPSFQTELQMILLQSYYFLALLFLVAQFLSYIAAFKNVRASYLYLKFYAVIAFTVALLISLKYQIFALLPAVIYVGGYYQFAKLFKESALVWQGLKKAPDSQMKKPLFY